MFRRRFLVQDLKARCSVLGPRRAAVGLVLLIACVNVANLLLVALRTE